MADRVEQEEIFSQVLRAGRRTYFFDVRATKADDYYLTVTESKKFTHDDGSFRYQKHKIYLYKEDFADFTEMLNKATEFIVNEKGDEVITNGGLLAKITDVDDGFLTCEIADKVEVKIQIHAVATVLPKGTIKKL